MDMVELTGDQEIPEYQKMRMRIKKVEGFFYGVRGEELGVIYRNLPRRRYEG